MKENNENLYDISERIKQVLDYLNVSVKDFSTNLGYKRPQSMYDFLSGRVKPSFDFFKMFVESEYSLNINLAWLIAGKGDMVLPESRTFKNQSTEIELVKKENNTEFRDLGNGKFLISTPIINQKYANVYVKRLQDTDAIAALRKHAVTAKELHFGEYLSVELDSNVSLGIAKTSQAPGSIVTGRKFVNWTNPSLGELAGMDCILILPNEIVVTTIKEYDGVNRNITINTGKQDLQDDRTINANDILEFYEIQIITNYDVNEFVN
jgi:hypothetical protein